MESNNLDFEISFFEGILKHRPNYIDALVPLAEAYTRKKLYGKGLEIDKRLSVLCEKDPIVYYNLACGYALMGESEKAIEALEKSISFGYTDFGHLVKDTDLKLLHSNPKFQKWIEESL